MPIYEYMCDACAYRFERKQSIKDAPVATCERCGKSVTRLISSPAIMFKGSGWYVTDYSDKLKPPAGSEAAAPSEKTPGEKKDGPSSSSSTETPVSAPASSSGTPSNSSPTSSGTSTPTPSTAK